MKKKPFLFSIFLCLAHIAFPAAVLAQTLGLYVLCPEMEWRCGAIDKAGNWVIKPEKSIKIWKFSDDGLAVARAYIHRDGDIDVKWGIIDTTGAWLIEPKFDRVWGFSSVGLAKAQINEKIGFVDRAGTWKIPPIYTNASNFDAQGFAVVDAGAQKRTKPSVGLMDTNGSWAVEPRFQDIESFGNADLAPAKKEGNWGYIDRKGNWVVEPTYKWVSRFHGEFACVQTHGSLFARPKRGYIDQTGSIIIALGKFGTMSCGGFGEDGLVTAGPSDTKAGFIDKNGNWVVEPIDGVWIGTYFVRGLVPFKHKETGLYGFVDTKGDVKIEPRFDYTSGFYPSGLAKVEVNDKWGAISTNGDYVAPTMYDDVDIVGDLIKVEFGQHQFGQYRGYLSRIGEPLTFTEEFFIEKITQ